MHSQEIPLVWRGPAGVALPTREFDGLLVEAKGHGDAHVHALFVQVARQRDAQGAIPHPKEAA